MGMSGVGSRSDGLVAENCNREIQFSSHFSAAGWIAGGNCSQYYLENDGMTPHLTRENKPPYRIPSMEEINAIPKNGFKSISFFAGCGGSSLGYRMAGFRVLWANEFIPAARESYLANASSSTIMDGRDIRQIRADAVLSAIGLRPGELDVLDGSPPCASFSTMGKRAAGWGKVKSYSDSSQRTDDLFFEYARMIDGIRPKVFVAENVSGLVKGVAKGYFKEILKRLGEVGGGYRVAARLLDAQWLGVPQARQRIIFVGVRKDLGVGPAFPSPRLYRYSVRDAIPWISFAKVGANGGFGTEEWQSSSLPAKTIGASPNSGNGRVGPGDVLITEEKGCDISRFAIGAEWDKLSPGEHSERFFNLVKPELEKPCPTISASGGSVSKARVVHPTEKRKFTIPEIRRLCSFPDDFKLSGSYAQQWERMGRAVPPVMMQAIAETVRDHILIPVRDRGEG